MTNTTAPIDISEIAINDIKGTIVTIFEQPVVGGGIRDLGDINKIYHADIVYEF